MAWKCCTYKLKRLGIFGKSPLIHHLSKVFLQPLFNNLSLVFYKYKKNKDAKDESFTSLRAESRTRTGDLLITNESLYQLSYIGFADLRCKVNDFLRNCQELQSLFREKYAL